MTTAHDAPPGPGLVAQLSGLERLTLVGLARLGRGLPPPPSFRGRCLEPAYLTAVAAGAWSPDDETRLGQLEAQLEAYALPKVRITDRRGLRVVLRGAALVHLTGALPVEGWSERCTALAGPWESLVGPLRAQPAAA